jgi:hypothetical protein
MLARLKTAFGIMVCVAVFVTAFFAFFVTAQTADGQLADGIGRSLSETPLLMRFLFAQGRFWAGWWWFIADFVWFFGGLLFGIALISKTE